MDCAGNLQGTVVQWECQYEWDHRNRLVAVIERDSDGGPATQIVEHTYDYLNRWVARAVDSDGDGPLGSVDTYFVYDGTPGDVSLDRAAVTTDQVGQIVLQFDDDAQGAPQLTHRYLWGPAVDQILADEAVTSLATPGDVLWPLPDHLGTVRDLAEYDDSTGVTTVTNHRTYDAFGRVVSETNAAIDHLFGFTGRALDESTGLQNNLNRWYDAGVGRWISQDPIGFEGGDANIYRYVGNGPTHATDPTGLVPWGTPEWFYQLPGHPQLIITTVGGQIVRCVIPYFGWYPTFQAAEAAWLAAFESFAAGPAAGAAATEAEALASLPTGSAAAGGGGSGNR